MRLWVYQAIGLMALSFLVINCSTTPREKEQPVQPPAPLVAPTPPPAPKPVVEQPKTPEPASDKSPCPDDMIYVDADYCTKMVDTCLDHLNMGYPRGCIEYSSERECVGEKRHQRFCIDTYEYPNKKGEYPPVVLDAYDAAALCREQGKRLCWESEWTAACEGSVQTPFPYGYRRNPEMCRIDQKPRNFDAKKMRSFNKAEQDAELRKITQHVPSGTMEGCKSDFGVHDMTGNVEEWIFIEKARHGVTWAGSKGGHWLKVRNACRPTGVVHSEPWTFYVLSFRCCQDHDASAVEPYNPKPGDAPFWTPPEAPVVPAPDGKVDRGWTRTKP